MEILALLSIVYDPVNQVTDCDLILKVPLLSFFKLQSSTYIRDRVSVVGISVQTMTLI